jgi:hypothetical protein
MAVMATKLTVEELARALERATALDRRGDDRYTAEDVVQIGAELGISERAIRSSLLESSVAPAGVDRLFGPPEARATALAPGDESAVKSMLHRELRRRRLQPVGDNIWEQRSGWWPDGEAFARVARVEVRVAAPRAGMCSAVLTVPLAHVRTGYVAVSLAAAALALVLVGGALSGLAAPLAAALVVGALAVVPLVAYRQRVTRIEQRLADLLAAAPDPPGPAALRRAAAPERDQWSR